MTIRASGIFLESSSLGHGCAAPSASQVLVRFPVNPCTKTMLEFWISQILYFIWKGRAHTRQAAHGQLKARSRLSSPAHRGPRGLRDWSKSQNNVPRPLPRELTEGSIKRPSIARQSLRSFYLVGRHRSYLAASSLCDPWPLERETFIY